MRTLLVHLFFLGLVLISQVQAIFEDQAGKHDWIKHNFGRTKIVAASPTEEQLFVASEANVLASFHTLTGHFLWRKDFSPEDKITFMETIGFGIGTLSSSNTLKVFNASGHMLWQKDVDAFSFSTIYTSSGKAKGIALATSVGVRVLGLDGKQVWTKSVEEPSQMAGIVSQLDDITYAGLLADRKTVSISRMDFENAGEGTETIRRVVSSSLKVGSGGQFKVVPGGAVGLSEDGLSVCGFFVLKESAECHRLKKEAKELFQLPGCPSALRLQYGNEGGTALVTLVSGGGIAVDDVAADHVALSCKANAAMYIQLKGHAGIMEIFTGVGTQEKSTTTAEGLGVPTVDGRTVPIVKVFLTVTVQHTPMALVLYENNDIAMIKAGSLAWSSRQSLANPVDIVFSDLPVTSAEVDALWASQQPSMVEKLKGELLSLISHLRPLSPPEKRKLEEYKALTSDALRPTRDADGFRRQLLVLGVGGTLTSLHTGDGRVLWSLQLSTTPSKLVAWTKSHDPKSASYIAAVTIGTDAIFWDIIDPIHGQVVQTLKVDVPARRASLDILPLPSPLHDHQTQGVDQHAYLVVVDHSIVHSVPFEIEKKKAPSPHVLHYWSVDRSTGVARGFSVQNDDTVVPQWSSQFVVGDTAKVLALATHDDKEIVYSSAKPLGNGGILNRYINKNTAIVVVGPSGHGVDVQEDAQLTVYLVDTVSGTILNSETHQGTGPVHAVMTESTAAVHFWSLTEHRWMVATIELYSAEEHGLKVLDLMLGRHSNASASLSSWVVPRVNVSSTTFFIRLPAAAMGITHTGRGITAKQVLMGTPGGQIYMLDKRFLDPRRPVVPVGGKPTQEQMAEGLPPYSPELPVAQTAFATYNKKVVGLKGIKTEPAVLESTSLLTAWGMDIYFARLAPSKAYDMVPEDFPYSLLVVSVLTLAIGLVVLRSAVHQRALKLKWE